MRPVLSQLWQIYLVGMLLVAMFFAVRGLQRGWRFRRGRRDVLLGVGLLGLSAALLFPRPHSFFIEAVVLAANCALIYVFATVMGNTEKSGAT